MVLDRIDTAVSDAVRHYWATLSDQEDDQQKSDNTARGRRAQVLGGSQMDGFAGLIEDALVEAGIPREDILHDHGAVLPGYYRATKRWDLAVVYENELLAVMELKSIASSFGNNLNNRIEEAVGSNTDLYQAYEEGLFEPSPNPWVGYLIMMADTEGSRRPVTVREPNFDVDDEFEDASYLDRAELLCLRMLRERLVDGAAFITSDEETGLEGSYVEPNPELTFERFITPLIAQVSARVEMAESDSEPSGQEKS